ncbi:MAG: TIGR00730 family Rossman fold protein [Candidatus Kerfeldbacteria bacterium]
MPAKKSSKKAAPQTNDAKKQTHIAKLRGEVINPTEFRGGEATWRIFRIMAEFVDGYDFLSKLTADVTVFGSARTKPGTKYYKMCEELTYKMAKHGLSVITGGGPGIMEAANKGAFKAGGESIGLNIQLPFEQRINKYVRHGLGFHFFFTRKVMLTSPSQAFVAFPGGFGTMDEVFEVMTLIQTHKMQPVPVILVGKEFWGTLAEKFIEAEMITHKTINPEDKKIYTVVDSADEAMAILEESVYVQTKKHGHKKSKKK